MTQTHLDINVLQLMASKICHDLISPIGAIGNGVEFIEDMGADAIDDAVPLIKHSATQASAKLQAYRIAYAAGGADGHIKPEDVYNAINGVIAGDGKVTQDWTPDANMAVPDDHYERPPAYCKFLICLLLMALDCMPKGGVLSVSADGTQTTVTATGENASFREQMTAALSLSLDNTALEPKHAHAVLTALLAQNYGYTIETASQDGAVSLTITHPVRDPIA